MSAKELTKETFTETIENSDLPVVIDFWADWCGPCKALAPILEEVADENAAEVRLYKVNIDEEPELREQFGVMSIPTLILFKDGEPVAQSVGVQPKDALEEFIKG